MVNRDPKTHPPPHRTCKHYANIPAHFQTENIRNYNPQLPSPDCIIKYKTIFLLICGCRTEWWAQKRWHAIAFYWGWFVFGIGHLCISFDNEITYLCHLCWFGCTSISKFGESFRRISLKSIHFKLKQKSTDFCTFTIKKRNIDLKYINKIVIVKMYIKSQISLLNIKIIVFDKKNGLSIF